MTQKTKPRNFVPATCFLIIIAAISGFVFLDNWIYTTQLPQMVHFSVQIPTYQNVVAIKVITDMPGVTDINGKKIYNLGYSSFSNYLQLPFTLNSTARIGDTYEIDVLYYSTSTDSINGNNIQSVPQYTQVHEQVYQIQVTKNNDGVASTYDFSFYFAILIFSIIISAIFGSIALFSIPDEAKGED